MKECHEQANARFMTLLYLVQPEQVWSECYRSDGPVLAQPRPISQNNQQHHQCAQQPQV
jgi:hypothetical protein